MTPAALSQAILAIGQGPSRRPPWFALSEGTRLKRLIETNLPGDGFAPVIFTEFDLAKRHVRTSELMLERCLADWKEVNRTLVAIARGTTWAPTPAPFREWRNGCE